MLIAIIVLFVLVVLLFICVIRLSESLERAEQKSAWDFRIARDICAEMAKALGLDVHVNESIGRVRVYGREKDTCEDSTYKAIRDIDHHLGLLFKHLGLEVKRTVVDKTEVVKVKKSR